VTADLPTKRHTGPAGHRSDYILLDDEPIYGGQGQTFRARLCSGRLGSDLDGAEIALKQLTAAAGPDAAKLLERDAILRRCRHPSLGRHLEVFLGPAPWTNKAPDEEDCDLLYTSALWVPGCSLQEAAAGAAVERIIIWIRQLAEALDYLHGGPEGGEAILHRDLHPGNVIITPDDTATIIDYGLARPAAGDTTTRLLGAPGFIPPERTQGAPPGPEADRWQLGMVSIAALLGHPRGVHSDEQVRSDLVDRLRGQVPRTGQLADNLLAMIDPDPSRRPSQVQAWSLGLGAERRAGRAVGRTSKHRYALGAGLAGSAALALVLLVAGLDQRGRPTQQGSEVAGSTGDTIWDLRGTQHPLDTPSSPGSTSSVSPAPATGEVPPASAQAATTTSVPPTAAPPDRGKAPTTPGKGPSADLTGGSTTGNEAPPTPSSTAAATPATTTSTPLGGDRTYPEQVWSLSGVGTFVDPHNATGAGQRIETGAWVEVSCKVYAPEIQSVNPDGYWYRIASPPWNGAFYSPANTFWNGDVPGQPYEHATDFAVPDCPS
jgi:serine/threonine protein kinase